MKSHTFTRGLWHNYVLSPVTEYCKTKGKRQNNTEFHGFYRDDFDINNCVHVILTLNIKPLRIKTSSSNTADMYTYLDSPEISIVVKLKYI